MKIITDANGLVLYAGEAISLTSEQAVSPSGSVDKSTTTSNAVLYDGVTLPADYPQVQYTYIGGNWARTAAGEEVAQRRAADLAQSRFTEIQTAVQTALDRFAQARGYDSLLSAASYSASTIPKFAEDAMICIAKRDGAWAAAYQLLAEVQTEKRPLPTVEEAMALMPPLVWSDQKELP